jgi:hypothetical protein
LQSLTTDQHQRRNKVLPVLCARSDIRCRGSIPSAGGVSLAERSLAVSDDTEAAYNQSDLAAKFRNSCIFRPFRQRDPLGNQWLNHTQLKQKIE